MAAQAQVDATTNQLISLDEAKNYLRVDFTEDNDYITELIKIAKVQVLNDTNQVCVETDITEFRDKWPQDSIIYLKYPGKLGQNFTLKYYDSSNTFATLTQDTDYFIAQHNGLNRIQIVNAPNLYDRINAIHIVYKVEPYDEENILPLKMAMYMLIQHYYDNRSPVTFLKVDELPFGYRSIINNYKNYIW
tara:strand:- start:3979 stop:4548 length:570 start_codon:yes stop_codon:yes gene_type:complete